MKYSKFTFYMEESARELISNRNSKYTGFEVTSLIEQEIALTLDQFDRLRSVQTYQNRSLCRVECYVDTELMQMEERTPRYSADRFPEREKFQQKLFIIESERRRNSIMYEDKMQNLQRRLLSLLQKHEQLNLRNSLGKLEKKVE